MDNFDVMDINPALNNDINNLANNAVSINPVETDIAKKVFQREKVFVSGLDFESLQRVPTTLKDEYKLAPYVGNVDKHESPVSFFMQRCFRKICVLLHISYKKDKVEFAKKILNNIVGGIEVLDEADIDPQSVKEIIRILKKERRALMKEGAIVNNERIGDLDKLIKPYDFFYQSLKKLSSIHSKKDYFSTMPKLVTLIEDKLSELSDKESIILPSNYLIQGEEYDGMLEILKNGDTFVLRFISSDPAVGTSAMQSLEKTKKLPFLEWSGSKEQIVQATINVMSQPFSEIIKADNLPKKLNKFLSKALGSISTSTTPVNLISKSLGDNISLSLLNDDNGLQEQDLILKYRTAQRSSNIRKKLFYAVKSGDKNYEQIAFITQYQSFIALIRAHPNLYKNKHIAEDIRESARYLVHKINMHAPSEQKMDLLQPLEEVLSKISSQTAKRSKKLDKMNLAKHKSSIEIEPNAFTVSGLKKVKAKGLAQKNPIDKDFEVLLKNISKGVELTNEVDKAFTEGLRKEALECRELYNKGKFKQLEEKINYLVEVLPNVPDLAIEDVDSIWMHIREDLVIPNSEPPTTILADLSRYFFEIERDLYSLVPTEEFMFSTCKLFVINDYIQDDLYKDNAFYVPYQDIEKPLASLYCSNPRIFSQSVEILKYLEDRQKNLSTKGLKGVLNYGKTLGQNSKVENWLKDNMAFKKYECIGQGITENPYANSLHTSCLMAALTFSAFEFVEVDFRSNRNMDGSNQNAGLQDFSVGAQVGIGGFFSPHIGKKGDFSLGVLKKSIVNNFCYRESKNKKSGIRPFMDIPSDLSGKVNSDGLYRWNKKMLVTAAKNKKRLWKSERLGYSKKFKKKMGNRQLLGESAQLRSILEIIAGFFGIKKRKDLEAKLFKKEPDSFIRDMLLARSYQGESWMAVDPVVSCEHMLDYLLDKPEYLAKDDFYLSLIESFYTPFSVSRLSKITPQMKSNYVSRLYECIQKSAQIGSFQHLPIYYEVLFLLAERCGDSFESIDKVCSNINQTIQLFGLSNGEIGKLNCLKHAYSTYMLKEEDLDNQQVMSIMNDLFTSQKYAFDDSRVSSGYLSRIHEVKDMCLSYLEKSNDQAFTMDIIRSICMSSDDVDVSGSMPYFTVGDKKVNLQDLLITTGKKSVVKLTQKQRAVIANSALSQSTKDDILENDQCIISDYKESSGSRVCVLSPIKHKNIRFIALGGKFIIQKKFNGHSHWMSMVESSGVEEQYKNGKISQAVYTLQKGHTFWYSNSSSKRMYLEDAGTGELIYRLESSKKTSKDKLVKGLEKSLNDQIGAYDSQDLITMSIGEIKRISDGSVLQNVRSSEIDPENIFTMLDSPENIQIWSKNGKPKEIIYPRLLTNSGAPLKYTIKVSITGAIALYGQGDFDGYRVCIDKEKFLDEHNMGSILPKGVDQYHILYKDPNGPAQLFMPMVERGRSQKILQGSTADYKSKVGQLTKGLEDTQNQFNLEHYSKWSNKTYTNFNNENEYLPCLVSLLDPISGVKMADRSHDSYLAYISMISKNYQEASDYLWKSTEMGPLTDLKLDIFQKIDSLEDSTLEGLIIKLKAKICHIRSLQNNIPKVSLEDMEDDIGRMVELKTLIERKLNTNDNLRLEDKASLTDRLSIEEYRLLEMYQNMSMKWHSGIDIVPSYVSASKSSPLKSAIEEMVSNQISSPEVAASALWVVTRSNAKMLKSKISFLQDDEILTRRAQFYFNQIKANHAAKQDCISLKLKDYKLNKEDIEKLQKCRIAERKESGKDGGLRRGYLKFEISEELKEELANLDNLYDLRLYIANRAKNSTLDNFKRILDEVYAFEKYIICKQEKEGVSDPDLKAQMGNYIDLFDEGGNTKFPRLKFSTEELLLGMTDDDEFLERYIELNKACQVDKDFIYSLNPRGLTANMILPHFKSYINMYESDPLLGCHQQANFPENWSKNRKVFYRFRMIRFLSNDIAGPKKKLKNFFSALNAYQVKSSVDDNSLSDALQFFNADPDRIRPAYADEGLNLINQHLNPDQVSGERHDRAIIALEKATSNIILPDVSDIEQKAVSVESVISQGPQLRKRLLEKSLCLESENIELEGPVAINSPINEMAQVLRGVMNVTDIDLPDEAMPLTSVIKISEYYEDIQYFSENFSSQSDPKELTKDEYKNLKEQFGQLVINYKNTNTLENTNSRLSAEQRIMNAISEVSDKVKDILHDYREMIPMRLVGLYVEGNLDVESIKQELGISISQDSVKSLEVDIEIYMEAVIYEKHLERVEMFMNSNDYKSLIDLDNRKELSSLLDLTRHYDKQEDASYYKDLLAIEFVNGFILRKSQVDTIRAMIDKPSVVRQLGMGEGKSSVILPFLLRRYTDGAHLGVGIVPESLYPIVKEELKSSCKNIFGQDLHAFEFDRNKPLDLMTLQQQLFDVKSAIEQKNPMITTRTSLLSFRDKYLEIIYEKSELVNQIRSGEVEPKEALKLIQAYESQLKIISEILDLFKTRGKVIADEVDTILNLRSEINYAIGDPEDLPKAAKEDAFAVFQKLAQWGSEAVDSDKLRLFTEIHNNQQQLLSELDKKKTCKLLAEDFYQQWADYITDDNDQFKSDLIQYLTDSSFESHIINNWIDTIENDRFKEEIGTTLNMLSKVFPNILAKTNLEHYGRDDAYGMFTIPYKSCRTPSKSEYGELLQRLGYTCMDYFQKGVSRSQCNNIIEACVRDYQLILENGMTPEGISEEAMEQALDLVNGFEEKYGYSLFEVKRDPSLVNEILEKVNKDPSVKLQYLYDNIFDHMVVAKKQVSSNVFDLVSLFSKGFSGFTGTTWNTNSYHRAIDTSGAKTPGTDGKSGEYLLREFQANNVNIIEMPEYKGSNLSVLEQVIESIGGAEVFFEKYDAIIDVGAYFKDEGLEEVVHQLLDKISDESEKRAVVYIDSDNNKLIHEKGKQVAEDFKLRPDIEKNEQFKIYDQSHTIGTDIKHKKGARALVTIRSTKVKDLQQAIWRMRGLRKGEHVDFIVAKEVKEEMLVCRNQYIKSLEKIIENGNSVNKAHLQTILDYYNSLPKDSLVMDDIIIFVNTVQDKEIKPINLQRHVMEFKEIVNTFRLDAFHEIYQSYESFEEKALLNKLHRGADTFNKLAPEYAETVGEIIELVDDEVQGKKVNQRSLAESCMVN